MTTKTAGGEALTTEDAARLWKIATIVAIGAFTAAGLVFELRDHEKRISAVEPAVSEMRESVHFLVCHADPKHPGCL